MDNCSLSTLLRKLKEIDCLASYSRRGKYYTLRASADFDAYGLWSHKGICFSRLSNRSRKEELDMPDAPVTGFRTYPYENRVFCRFKHDRRVGEFRPSFCRGIGDSDGACTQAGDYAASASVASRSAFQLWGSSRCSSESGILPIRFSTSTSHSVGFTSCKMQILNKE